MSAGVLFAQADRAGASAFRGEESVQRRADGIPKTSRGSRSRVWCDRVFFSNVERPVRQVVFSALDPETDVKSICRQVGEALALETAGERCRCGRVSAGFAGCRDDQSVPRNAGLAEARRCARPRLGCAAICGWCRRQERMEVGARPHRCIHIWARCAASLSIRLWKDRLPGSRTKQWPWRSSRMESFWCCRRSHTRRVVARKIKEMLEAAQARILGTVLSDRVFPIPERIYRRL